MSINISFKRKVKAVLTFVCVMVVYWQVVDYIFEDSNPPLETFSYQKRDAEKLQQLCLSLNSTYDENRIDNSLDLSVRKFSSESRDGRRLFYWVPEAPEFLAVPEKNYCRVILDRTGYVLKAEFTK
ncbi:hypothetical protein ACJJIE_06285 [Microbulbifer sp. TRSA001]|uniref:hypothetical protein n=1 Tax=Microbulbifer sp. TRSA001 TaxID=3243381 RepID=UPI00403A7B4D